MKEHNVVSTHVTYSVYCESPFVDMQMRSAINGKNLLREKEEIEHTGFFLHANFLGIKKQ